MYTGFDAVLHQTGAENASAVKLDTDSAAADKQRHSGGTAAERDRGSGGECASALCLEETVVFKASFCTPGEMMEEHGDLFSRPPCDF